MADPHASTLKFQEYCTSPIFTILAGRDEVPFTVHSKLLRDKSPVIRAIMEDEPVSENETTVMRWTKWRPETVASFLQWLYTGEYECIVPYVIEQPGTESDCKSDEEDDRENEEAPEPRNWAPPTVHQEVQTSPHLSSESNEEEEVPDLDLGGQTTLDQDGSVYDDAREDGSEIWGVRSARTDHSSSDAGTISARNGALQTAVAEAQSQLAAAKATNEEAMRAALESLSLSLRIRLQTPTSDTSSSGAFGQLGDFAEVASRIMAELREQEIRVQDLRNTAEELQGAAATAAMVARDSRLDSLFGQRPDETRGLARAAVNESQERVTESGLSIAEELEKPLMPMKYKTASDYSARGTQLYTLESAITTLGLETLTENDPGRRKSIYCFDALAQHIEVYALAHCAGASDLGTFAFHAFHILLKVLDFYINLGDTDAFDTFAAVIETAFAMTASGPLRELIARLAAWRHRKLLAVSYYTNLVAAGGDFAVQLALNLEREKLGNTS